MATRGAEDLHFHAGLLEAVQQSVIATDLSGTIIYWNPFAESVFGWPRAEVLGRKTYELLSPDGRETHLPAILAHLRQGQNWVGDITLRRRDGTLFICLVTDSPLLDPSGTLVGVIMITIDVNARDQAERARARLAAIITSSKDAIIAKTLDGTITDWNAGAEALYGYTSAEIIGRTVAVLMPPERVAEAADFLVRVAGGESIEHVETIRLHQDGRRLNMSVSILPIRDRKGEVIGATTIGRDITGRKAAHAQLTYQAMHDGLTGLPNRAMLNAELRRTLAAEYAAGLPVALLLLDLDWFKEVNYMLGHHAGDTLLQQIGQRLQGASRSADVIARLGGDEFAVLLPATDATAAAQVAELLLRGFDPPFAIDGQPIAVEASVGIAAAPNMVSTPIPCCAAPTWRCIRPSGPGRARRPTARPTTSTAPTGWHCSANCGARSTRTNCSCTTNPNSTCAMARWSAWRRWCAGSTRSEGSCLAGFAQKPVGRRVEDRSVVRPQHGHRR